MAATAAQSSVIRALLPRNAPASKSSPASLNSRRNLLFLMTAVPALSMKESVSRAQDIPLFGLKRKLKKAEEEAELLVKEGFETAEKGLETAEKGLVTAEIGIEEAVSFGGLAQAGAVFGAEAVAVLVATSVVSGILGPDA
ncbi:unnamed protein product [Linum tenue]|uniref:Synechocystis YCF37 n=1 Tax=Linum tenue TaxID=586396 RepID=A0AAV0R8W9_9ROSI|nr:unnamed protein product [Linum tenue]